MDFRRDRRSREQSREREESCDTQSTGGVIQQTTHDSDIDTVTGETGTVAGTGAGGAGVNVKERSKENRTESSALLIRWDLPRTFPTLKFFHDGGSIQADLERILCAYAIYRPDVGYVQGMSFVAAMLLLYMDDGDAFVCLVNLLSRKGTRDFFSLQRMNVERYVRYFDHFFEQSLPLLFAHVRSQGLTSEMFLMDWHLTVFSKALPLDVAARVWDCYLAGGELFSLRCALGILRLYAPHLCTLTTESLMKFLTHLPSDLNADKLLDSVGQIKISHSTYRRFISKNERREKRGSEKEARDSPDSTKAAGGSSKGGTDVSSNEGSNCAIS